MLPSVGSPDHFLAAGHFVQLIPPGLGAAAPEVDLRHPGVGVSVHWEAGHVLYVQQGEVAPPCVQFVRQSSPYFGVAGQSQETALLLVSVSSNQGRPVGHHHQLPSCQEQRFIFFLNYLRWGGTKRPGFGEN